MDGEEYRGPADALVKQLQLQHPSLPQGGPRAWQPLQKAGCMLLCGNIDPFRETLTFDLERVSSERYGLLPKKTYSRAWEHAVRTGSVARNPWHLLLFWTGVTHSVATWLNAPSEGPGWGRGFDCCWRYSPVRTEQS